MQPFLSILQHTLKLIGFGLSLLIPFAGACQNQIKGHVSDEKKMPAAFCSVALLDTSGAIVKGSATDADGNYLFENIKPGRYALKATAIGSADTTSRFFSIDSITNFVADTLQLKPGAIALGEVSVTDFKKTIEYKDGMIVMNVESSVVTTGNTVIELLRRMPGVYIDAQGNIFLDGKGGTRVMIDGKLQLLSGQQLYSFLNSMSSENVSKIELMKIPPARYDAAGSGGMINIITKKVKLLGVSGNISGGASQGKLFRAGGDGSLNYKTKKVTLFSNFGVGHRDFYSPYVFNKTIALPGRAATYMFEDGAQINYQRAAYYKAGMDIYLTDKTTIGAVITGGPSQNPMLDSGINRISGLNTLGFEKSYFHILVGDQWTNPSYNINLEQKLDTSGSTLTYAGDFSQYTATRQSVGENSFLNANDSAVLPANNYRSTHHTRIRILTQKADLRKYLKGGSFLEAGAKFTSVDSHNNYTFEHQNNSTGEYFTDTSYSNVYQYNENVIAGYINYKKQFKKASLQIGGRGENTIVAGKNETSGFTLTRNYFNFFPNLSFDYPISDNHTLQANFSRRLDRPVYNWLNPFKSYQDNFSATIGNPYLMPQYSYNSSLTYILKQTYFSTFSYSRINDLLFGIDYQNDSTKETISSIINIAANNYFSYSFYAQKKITKIWMFSGSAVAYYSEVKGIINNVDFDRSVKSVNAYLSNDFILPKNFKMQLSLFYNGPSINGTSYQRDFWALDLGIRKTFFNDKLTVNLVLYDIFYRNYTQIHSKFINQDYIFISKRDTRRVWLSLNYRFGKMRIQKRDVNSNEQEKGRLNKEGGR